MIKEPAPPILLIPLSVGLFILMAEKWPLTFQMVYLHSREEKEQCQRTKSKQYDPQKALPYCLGMKALPRDSHLYLITQNCDTWPPRAAKMNKNWSFWLFSLQHGKPRAKRQKQLFMESTYRSVLQVFLLLYVSLFFLEYCEPIENKKYILIIFKLPTMTLKKGGV